ncbi:MAG: T9SS type A sorting domain-containing protein, partial [Bacteroidota bacterium]|nr:T9SS type A sorting domain-containing protein [Bacteroidota bacterium]
LGIEPFTSPYQSIAADANNSKTITAIDIVVLRKLILGYFDTFPENSSWRFIDAAHVFPDPSNPWVTTWSELYSIQPFANSMNDVNFNAVKVGDINLSASLVTGNSFIQTRNDDRCIVEYKVSNQPESGVYKVELILKNARKFNALQFSFDWYQAGFEVIDWAAGDELSKDNIRMATAPGDKSSLLAFTADQWTNSETSLLTMWVKEKPGNVMPFTFYLSSGPTASAAYTYDDEAPRGIDLQVVREQIGGVYNKPNPFKDITTIIYESKIKDEAILHVYDMSGKLVMTRTLQLEEGKNEMLIHRSELSGTGIYLYDISSAQQYSTNRMLIVE